MSMVRGRVEFYCLANKRLNTYFNLNCCSRQWSVWHQNFATLTTQRQGGKDDSVNLMLKVYGSVDFILCFNIMSAPLPSC